MKKYQSSYVLKQMKKKRIFEKKIHMDFPYGFSIQLDTRLICCKISENGLNFPKKSECAENGLNFRKKSECAKKG